MSKLEAVPRIPMISFAFDVSFSPYSLDAELYANIAKFIDHRPPASLTGLGSAVLRWMYLHAIYRLSPKQSHEVDIPAQLMSLSCGLAVFLAVYLRGRQLDGASLLAGCEAWLETVREARRVAEAARVEAERRTSTN